jgi:hypothetical protein
MYVFFSIRLKFVKNAVISKKQFFCKNQYGYQKRFMQILNSLTHALQNTPLKLQAKTFFRNNFKNFFNKFEISMKLSVFYTLIFLLKQFWGIILSLFLVFTRMRKTPKMFKNYSLIKGSITFLEIHIT